MKRVTVTHACLTVSSTTARVSVDNPPRTVVRRVPVVGGRTVGCTREGGRVHIYQDVQGCIYTRMYREVHIPGRYLRRRDTYQGGT